MVRSQLQKKGQKSNIVSTILSLLIVIAIGAAGCTNDPPPNEDPIDPKALGRVNFTVFAKHLRKVRAGESLHVWGRFRSDSEWTRFAMIKVVSLRKEDSGRLTGRYDYYRSLDELERMMVSVEAIDSPTFPTAPIMAGALHQDVARLTHHAADAIGDLSKATASLIFTTRSSDTSRYKREFYIASKNGNELTGSMRDLPGLPAAWKYGIWMEDSNYFPNHRFFYGFLGEASGPDSRNTKDSYPLPGGFEGPSLNKLGGKLRITLEPSTRYDALPEAGPSPYAVMYAPLPKHISKDQSIPLVNIDSTGLPSATIVLKR